MVSGCYDVVLDANNNSLYDSCADGIDVAQVRLVNVIPEVPLGSVVASFGMIDGVVGFAGFKRQCQNVSLNASNKPIVVLLFVE